VRRPERGDMPIVEHIRVCLEHLPYRSYPRGAQLANVITFLGEHIARTQRLNITKLELRSFPHGDYESHAAAWRQVIAEGLIDWNGVHFVLNRALLPPQFRGVETGA
jgi:hypothetical protein